MASLYDTDALAWSEQQADLLRRLAAGEPLNEAVDWANVIEEVQDVGLSLLRTCRSLLLQAMVHLLKLHAWPSSRSVEHWKSEAGVFLDDAEDGFAPSMRQHIDLGEATDAAGAPNPLPQTCPFTLPELLAGDLAELRAKLAAAATPPS